MNSEWILIFNHLLLDHHQTSIKLRFVKPNLSHAVSSLKFKLISIDEFVLNDAPLRHIPIEFPSKLSQLAPSSYVNS